MELDGDDLVAYFDERVEVPAGGGWEAVDARDHVAAYFAELEPVDVGALVVAPTHREATLRPGQAVVWCDPGMAFGTGHHESTRLALRALGARDLLGRRVLDVGSGSGILAIAASVLGADEVLGLDVDPSTLPEARANARGNRARVRFDHVDASDLGPDTLGRFDVVVANLFAELHVRLMPTYEGLLAPGGAAILSGITAERCDLVLEAAPPALSVVARAHEGGWCLLELARAAS